MVDVSGASLRDMRTFLETAWADPPSSRRATTTAPLPHCLLARRAPIVMQSRAPASHHDMPSICYRVPCPRHRNTRPLSPTWSNMRRPLNSAPRKVSEEPLSVLSQMPR
eukprot:scaffold26062_cov31-Tisochrysis_lutea.AAC.2